MKENNTYVNFYRLTLKVIPCLPYESMAIDGIERFVDVNTHVCMGSFTDQIIDEVKNKGLTIDGFVSHVFPSNVFFSTWLKNTIMKSEAFEFKDIVKLPNKDLVEFDACFNHVHIKNVGSDIMTRAFVSIERY